MKTIKFTLTGLLSLFIAVLLIKYAIIYLNYTTIDFNNPLTKESNNFALTFGIASIVLFALACIAITFAWSSFSLTHKYWIKSSNESRTKELLKHIEDKKYEQLVINVRNTNSVEEKEQIINDYLNANRSKLVSNAAIQGIKAHEQVEKWLKEERPVTPDEAYKAYPNRMAKAKTTHSAIKDVLSKASTNVPTNDMVDFSKTLQFDKKVYKD